jgi:hypothetical protein
MLKIEDVEEENDDNSFEDSSSEFESSPSSSRHRKQERMVLQEQKNEIRKRCKSNDSTILDAEEQSPADKDSDFDIEAKSEDYGRERKLHKAHESDFL